LNLTSSTTSTQTITRNANGSYMFPTRLPGGSNWSVSISAQPVGMTCAVTGGLGANLSVSVTSVNVTCTAIPDDCSPASTGTNCTWSNLASPITKSINYPSDHDWIRFTPATSGQWTFTASKPASNPLYDSVGTLHNASGAILVSNDDSAGNYQFKVQANLTAGQTYYLEVYGWSSYTGNYTVTATHQ
jgi:hypothetical protein